MKKAMIRIQFEITLTNEIIEAQKNGLRGPAMEKMYNAVLSVPLTSVDSVQVNSIYRKEQLRCVEFQQ